MIDNWHNHTPHTFFSDPSSSSSSSFGGSSHLSILTSTSTSSALSEVHPQSPPPSSPSISAGQKTNAFFASPFSNNVELAPPPALTRSSSVASTSSHPREPTEDDTDATPRLSSAPAPKTGRSMNDSFFGSSTSATLPTPPPSIRSFTKSSAPTSPENSPPSSPHSAPRSRLPPLSRFFPSRARYTHVDELPSRQNSLKTHSPTPDALSTISGHRRDFVSLESDSHHTEHHGSEHGHQLYKPADDAASAERKPWSKALNVLIPPAAGSSSLPTPVATTHNSPPPVGPAPALHVGDIITEAQVSDIDSHSAAEHDGALKLELVRTLGQGAFSSVWLAKDVSDRVENLEIVRKSSLKRSISKSSRKGSLRKKRSMRKKIEGAVPKVRVADEEMEDGMRIGSVESLKSLYRDSEDRIGRTDERDDSESIREGGRLVALKMTDRSLCDKDDRTRVSFVREVEVLKHISHPSIVSYIHAFSTPAYHVLVLESVNGGELFDLVSTPELHARIDEPLLRRIFGELCRAVSWMHAVGLVHRDIKLENILLTRSAFSDPFAPSPLIKLTDFGLSRFIDPASPLLTTRCGSESYAAPELVTGRPYDGRQTDAWACGVVLYALVTRRLPFDAVVEDGQPTHVRHEEHETEPKRVRGPRRDERAERRALLMRIAKGEFAWPAAPEADVEPAQPLRGLALVNSEGVRRVVNKLLVRNPQKRSSVQELWDDEWLFGEGAPPPPLLPDNAFVAHTRVSSGSSDDGLDQATIAIEAWEDALGPEDAEVDDEDEDVDEGVLVDEQEIGPGSVVHQEH